MSVVLTLVVQNAALAAPHCDLVLLSHYVSGHPVSSEKGSLESKYPGIADAVEYASYGVIPFFSWGHVSPIHLSEANEFIEKLQQIETEVLKIPTAFRLSPRESARFIRVGEILMSLRRTQIRSIRNAIIERWGEPTRRTPDVPLQTSLVIRQFQSTLDQVQSTLLALLISTKIEGKNMFFENYASRLHSEPRTGLSRGKGSAQMVIDREIDLIVEKQDGRILWIEVKNNLGQDPPREVTRYSLRSLLDSQLIGQINLRKQLGLEKHVQIVVFLRFPTQNLELQRLASELGVEIRWVFSSREGS